MARATIETHPWSKKPRIWNIQLDIDMTLNVFGGWQTGLSQNCGINCIPLNMPGLLSEFDMSCFLLFFSKCFINCFYIGCSRYLGRGEVSIKHWAFYSRGALAPFEDLPSGGGCRKDLGCWWMKTQNVREWWIDFWGRARQVLKGLSLVGTPPTFFLLRITSSLLA